MNAKTYKMYREWIGLSRLKGIAYPLTSKTAKRCDKLEDEIKNRMKRGL